MERRKPVLIVQHARHEHPAIIRRALESQGIQTAWIHPYRGDPYPELHTIRGVISLGGPMGANDQDEYPWIERECSLLAKSASEGLPTVGICLGGQMLAKGLGAEVIRNPIAEVGWFPIEPSAEGLEDKIIGSAGPLPLVYHWHNDTFILPLDSVLLASSKACARQAFRFGERAYGFQFHPEADHQLIHEWLAVAGVEDEIAEARAEHGEATVQVADAQRLSATEGERSSLRIATGIAQLFETRAYACVPRAFHDQIKSWIEAQTLLTIELEGPDRRLFHVWGRMVMFFTLPDGEFVIFREETNLLWPLRLDSIRSLKMA